MLCFTLFFSRYRKVLLPPPLGDSLQIYPNLSDKTNKL